MSRSPKSRPSSTEPPTREYNNVGHMPLSRSPDSAAPRLDVALLWRIDDRTITIGRSRSDDRRGQHIDRPLLQCASSSCSSTCRKSTCRLFLSVTSTCRQMQLSACLVFPHRHAADAMLPYPLARGGTLARRLNASAFICMAHPSKRRPTCRWMQSQRCRGWAHSEHNARCTGSMGDGS